MTPAGCFANKKNCPGPLQIGKNCNRNQKKRWGNKISLTKLPRHDDWLFHQIKIKRFQFAMCYRIQLNISDAAVPLLSRRGWQLFNRINFTRFKRKFMRRNGTAKKKHTHTQHPFIHSSHGMSRLFAIECNSNSFLLTVHSHTHTNITYNHTHTHTHNTHGRVWGVKI